MQDYTHLMVLALNPGDFYESSRVDLRIMPAPPEQKSFFTHFSQRVMAIMNRFAAQGITHTGAEAIAYREIEEEILRSNHE